MAFQRSSSESKIAIMWPCDKLCVSLHTKQHLLSFEDLLHAGKIVRSDGEKNMNLYGASFFSSDNNTYSCEAFPIAL